MDIDAVISEIRHFANASSRRPIDIVEWRGVRRRKTPSTQTLGSGLKIENVVALAGDHELHQAQPEQTEMAAGTRGEAGGAPAKTSEPVVGWQARQLRIQAQQAASMSF